MKRAGGSPRRVGDFANEVGQQAKKKKRLKLTVLVEALKI